MFSYATLTPIDGKQMLWMCTFRGSLAGSAQALSHYANLELSRVMSRANAVVIFLSQVLGWISSGLWSQVHQRVRLPKLILAVYTDIEASAPQYIDAGEDEQRLQTFLEWAISNGP